MTSHTSVHVLIRGRVQGVGYRAWTAARARELKLTGFVRNRRDGAVEAVFGGEAPAVQKMLELCREGPLGARVTAVETVGKGVSAFAAFEVLPTV
ncbi:MAG: acylphosphatase [Hyphomicrobiales bacterium]